MVKCELRLLLRPYHLLIKGQFFETAVFSLVITVSFTAGLHVFCQLS